MQSLCTRCRCPVRFLGLCGTNTLHKTVSTTFFLYFACILPSIALGVLNYNNTGGMIGKILYLCEQLKGSMQEPDNFHFCCFEKNAVKVFNRASDNICHKYSKKC